MSEPAGLFLCLVLLLLVTEIFKVEVTCLINVAQKRCTMAGLHSLWDLLLLFCAQWNEALGQARKESGIRRWNLPSSNNLSQKKVASWGSWFASWMAICCTFFSRLSKSVRWLVRFDELMNMFRLGKVIDWFKQRLRHASNISLGNSAFVNGDGCRLKQRLSQGLGVASSVLARPWT